MLKKSVLGSMLMFSVALTGCGGTNSEPSPQGSSVTSVAQQSTRTILIRSVLAKAIPTAVTQLRFTGKAGTAPIYGPYVRPKATEISLEVPRELTELTIEYLVGDKVAGIYTTPLSLADVSTITISEPAFVNTPFQTKFIAQPSGVVQNSVMAPPVRVQLQDIDGQPVNGTNNVTVSLVNNSVGSTLAGTKTVSAVNGVATFNNLAVDRRGTFALQATSGDLTANNSSSFNVTAAAGVPFQLTFVGPPGTTNATTPMAPVSVAIQDFNGVTVPSSSGNVTIAIGTNPGQGNLTGVQTVSASNGVATFSSLQIDNKANGYTFIANTDAIQVGNVTSSPFNITSAPPAVFSNSRGGKLYKIDPVTLTFGLTPLSANGGSSTALGIDPVSGNLFAPGVFTGNSDLMNIFRSTTLRIVTTVVRASSTFSPKRIGADPTRGRMYIPSPAGLAVFDTSTNIEVGGSPVAVGSCFGLAFDTRRDLIYTFVRDAQQNTQLVVVDASTLQPVTGSPFALPGPDANFDSPSKVVYDSVNDNIIWTTGSGSGQNRMHVMNAATRQLRPFSPVTTGVTCRGVAVDAVNNRIYVASFQDNAINVFNATTFANVITTAPTNTLGSPEDVYYDPSTNRVFVSNFNGGGVTVFDAANMTVNNVVAPSSVNGVTNPFGDAFDQLVGGP